MKLIDENYIRIRLLKI